MAQVEDVSQRELVEWLADQQEAMLSLLADLVNIDSGSHDKSGVDRVGERIVAFLSEHRIPHEVIPLDRQGDVIVAGDAKGGDDPLLLLGHRDTVFPAGEASRRPFRVKDGRAYGPGVADMKAGLVMNSFILAAFRRFDVLSSPMQALYTGDEEIASPGSRPVIEQFGRNARAVFNAEPGRPNGNVVVARRGGVFMRFEIAGRAAHSGVNYADGISAIEELARKVTALHALTVLDAGVTVNVGLVSGGQSVNTVAPSASGEIDLRYTRSDDRGRMIEAIQEIVDTSFVGGTSSKLTVAGEFLAMERSPEGDRLLALYQDAAGTVGFETDGEFTGGCADSGLTASVGTPTLCAVGPVGGKPHSEDEYLDVASLVPRAQALALTLMRLDRTG